MSYLIVMRRSLTNLGPPTSYADISENAVFSRFLKKLCLRVTYSNRFQLSTRKRKSKENLIAIGQEHAHHANLFHEWLQARI